jgi:hypothetical protein
MSRELTSVALSPRNWSVWVELQWWCRIADPAHAVGPDQRLSLPWVELMWSVWGTADLLGKIVYDHLESWHTAHGCWDSWSTTFSKLACYVSMGPDLFQRDIVLISEIQNSYHFPHTCIFFNRWMNLKYISNLNLGCLHPVACVRSGDGGFLFCLHNFTIVG